MGYGVFLNPHINRSRKLIRTSHFMYRGNLLKLFGVLLKAAVKNDLYKNNYLNTKIPLPENGSLQISERIILKIDNKYRIVLNSIK